MRRGVTRRRLPAATLAAVLISAILPTHAAAVTYEFPPGETGYHTYEEMVAELAATVADYPSLVETFSIGKSYQGREIWAAKVSDNVATDEAEPEVLLEGLHHGDEHMALEMTLAMLRWLTDGYGSDPRVAAIVDSREIWIVFAVNPDGATWNIKDRVYQDWRKNRQPNTGSSYVGTDLNRNYDYYWGCCGGASSDPASSRYRGRAPFSAPETRAVRDFVNGRVVGGRQQIRASISFHTTGRLVAWPFSYTTTDLPATMTASDRAAFVAMGKAMAARNGYTPQQAGDRYVHSGTALDWLYGRHRIMAFLFELEPATTLYMHDEQIPSETGRNRTAVLYLLEQAGCPWAASGASWSNCGPLYDDVEISRGWTREAGTAAAGALARGNPVG
ncbi:MAG TPA: M14 family metallopeptidase, partial [Candidatus Limnocylindrales bacterium]|nr:M14 family metallopeptidase [Candidatus Limnocylindrales bacterium]